MSEPEMRVVGHKDRGYPLMLQVRRMRRRSNSLRRMCRCHLKRCNNSSQINSDLRPRSVLFNRQTARQADGHVITEEASIMLNASTQVIDPVCGMHIDPTDAAGKSEHNGHTYYFCHAHCQRHSIRTRSGMPAGNDLFKRTTEWGIYFYAWLYKVS